MMRRRVAAVVPAPARHQSDAFARLAQSAVAGEIPDHAPPAVPDTSADDATSLYAEALSALDAFGGTTRPDYFRDPAAGYAPQYAPRLFAEGGAVAYHHPVSDIHYDVAMGARDAADDAVSTRALSAARERARLRDEKDPAAAVATSAAAHLEEYQAAAGRYVDTAVRDGFREASVPRGLRSAVPSWTPPSGALPSLPAEVYHTRTAEAERTGALALETEVLRGVHGLREWERFEEENAQRGRFQPFPGYDADRAAAGRQGKLHGQGGVGVLVSPASIDEAQAAVRKHSVPSHAAVVNTVLANNTAAAAPRLGEGLAAQVSDALDATAKDSDQRFDAARKEALGLGRQQPLVSESGPDRRTQQLHRNDERLLNAALFEAGAYRAGAHDGDETDPYSRGRVTTGVAHLWTNQFDIDRRVALQAAGRQDPLERSEIHHGVPQKQSTDERVRWRFGARQERPTGFFTPKPSRQDMQLYAAHDDVAGFPLFRQRPGPNEFELFLRYRAHHDQRRALALKAGLEPRPNETSDERTARRQKLDALCEATPFDDARFVVAAGEQKLPTAALRQWFGEYWLPSPTVCAKLLGEVVPKGVHLAGEEHGGLGADTREHLLSSRYVNRLLTVDAFNSRVLRGYIKETLRKAPEAVIAHRQPWEVLRHFTPEQRRGYDAYLKAATEKHLQEWAAAIAGRRWVAQRGEEAAVARHWNLEVTDAVELESGQRVVLPWKTADAALQQQQDPEARSANVVVVGDLQMQVVSGTRRVEPFVSCKTVTGDQFDMLEAEWSALPEAAPAPGDPNTHINSGVGAYAYNRSNYVETQDALWEQRATAGDEGWAVANAADALVEGLPVRARRMLPGHRRGDHERATVVHYDAHGSLNPDPRVVTVRFAVDGVEASVRLADTMIWQATPHGPDRTTPLKTREYLGNTGLRRHVNVADPRGVVAAARADPHFLDKYTVRKAESAAVFRSTKRVTDLDEWRDTDRQRPENHRLLSGESKKKTYVRGGFFHRYTPWEWIALQESEQPLLLDQLRSDNTGPSHHFTQNRFWRYKRRPFGFLKNFDAEIRDWAQYVDGITPWAKAKHIRTHWEARTHHPMPAFMKPTLGLHRNSTTVLPTHLWEADKKTGKVKALKDTVRDYKTTEEYPAWMNL